MYEASRQFVRKISGYRTPSRRNQQVFDDAIEEITGATRRMLQRFADIAKEDLSSKTKIPTAT
jgi:hypothetical protein